MTATTRTVTRLGIGHRPARAGELCPCGEQGTWTWLDNRGRACATTCPHETFTRETTGCRADTATAAPGESPAPP